MANFHHASVYPNANIFNISISNPNPPLLNASPLTAPLETESILGKRKLESTGLAVPLLGGGTLSAVSVPSASISPSTPSRPNAATAAFQQSGTSVVTQGNVALSQATAHSQAVDPALERARKQLKLDQDATQQMLFQTPFSTVSDVWRRLMPFHIFLDPNEVANKARALELKERMISERTPMLTAKVGALFAEVNALEDQWSEEHFAEAVLNRKLSRNDTDLAWTEAMTTTERLKHLEETRTANQAAQAQNSATDQKLEQFKKMMQQDKAKVTPQMAASYPASPYPQQQIGVKQQQHNMTQSPLPTNQLQQQILMNQKIMQQQLQQAHMTQLAQQQKLASTTAHTLVRQVQAANNNNSNSGAMNNTMPGQFPQKQQLPSYQQQQAMLSQNAMQQQQQPQGQLVRQQSATAQKPLQFHQSSLTPVVPTFQNQQRGPQPQTQQQLLIQQQAQQLMMQRQQQQMLMQQQQQVQQHQLAQQQQQLALQQQAYLQQQQQQHQAQSQYYQQAPNPNAQFPFMK